AGGKVTSAWRWSEAQVTPKRATAAGVALVLAIGLGFFITASDGRKQVDIGSSIVGGLIVGLAIIVAERNYSRTVGVKLEDVTSLTPTAPVEHARDDPDRPTSELAPEPASPPPGRYTVQFDARERVRNRADAFQARLRMFREQNYVQFVTALAPGRVESLPEVHANEFWWSFSRLAGQLAEKALREGTIPLEDPTMAYEVHPDIETAIRLARRERTSVAPGAVVWEFEVGFAAVLRRAAAEGLSVRVGFKN